MWKSCFLIFVYLTDIIIFLLLFGALISSLVYLYLMLEEIKKVKSSS